MPLTEHRTQIYLTDAQYRAAKQLAAERGDSLAGLIREALAAYLVSVRAGAGGAPWSDQPLAGVVGSLDLSSAAGGGEDLDEAIDASVYDEI